METNKPNSSERASRRSGLRLQVAKYIFDEPETFVGEVAAVAAGLPLPPIKRTILGCLKVLGVHFGGITQEELAMAVLVVQVWITSQKSE